MDGFEAAVRDRLAAADVLDADEPLALVALMVVMRRSGPRPVLGGDVIAEIDRLKWLGTDETAD